MKVNIKALAATSAIIWGGGVLMVGMINLIRPSYGRDFLRMMSTLYPGYKFRPSAAQVAVATGYALVDGATAGALFGLVYNRFAPAEEPMRRKLAA